MNFADSGIDDADWIATSKFRLSDPFSVPRTQQKHKVPSVSFVADAIYDRVDARVEHTQHDSEMMHRSAQLSFVVFKQQIIQLVWKPTQSQNQRC